MSLEYNELEPIIEKICEKIRTEICNANRLDMLDMVLEKYGEESILLPYGRQRKGDKVLVLGDLSIKKEDIANLLRRFKLDEKSFEFIDYDEITNFNFSKLIGNCRYADIFVGPVPHKASGIGNHSSVINYLKSTNEIPAKISVLKDNNDDLKITKKTFRKALEESDILNS